MIFTPKDLDFHRLACDTLTEKAEDVFLSTSMDKGLHLRKNGNITFEELTFNITLTAQQKEDFKEWAYETATNIFYSTLPNQLDNYEKLSCFNFVSLPSFSYVSRNKYQAQVQVLYHFLVSKQERG